MGKIWFFSVLIIFIAFMAVIIQTFRPVRNVQPDDVMQVNGVITDIKEGAGFDIMITLKDDNHQYYINRGLQDNLTIEQLQKQVLDQLVTLHVVKRWTIFTRDKNMGHISKLMIDNTILFNEINE